MASGAVFHDSLLARVKDDDPAATAAPSSPGQPRGVPGQPFGGTLASIMLTLISVTVLSALLTLRMRAIRSWRLVPFVVWLLFAVYADSYAFVFSSAIVQFAVNANAGVGECDAAVLACLFFYITTKTLIYLFLVEKAYIIRERAGGKRRMQSWLYLFNTFGIMAVLIVIIIFNFVYRIKHLEGGMCYIGLERKAMIPLISFDVMASIYLTVLFLIPLTRLYSFRNAAGPPRTRLRKMATKTFIASCCILTSSATNLTVLMALNDEPSWVCFMCCNGELLFSALALFWITSRDNHASTGSRQHVHRGDNLGRVEVFTEGAAIGNSGRRYGSTRTTISSSSPTRPTRNGSGLSGTSVVVGGAAEAMTIATAMRTATAMGSCGDNATLPPLSPSRGRKVLEVDKAPAIKRSLSMTKPRSSHVALVDEELRDVDAALCRASKTDSSEGGDGKSLRGSSDSDLERSDDAEHDEDGDEPVNGGDEGSSSSVRNRNGHQHYPAAAVMRQTAEDEKPPDSVGNG